MPTRSLDELKRKMLQDPNVKEEYNKFWEHPLWDNRWNECLREMMDVVALGASKHGPGTWADKDNPSLKHKACMSSIFRHAAQESVKQGVIDEESGRKHLTHLLCRAIMKLTHDKIHGSK